MDPKKDYYKILGVAENATADEIKRAYRKLAKEYHPDRRGGDKQAEERFKEISEAYQVLGDEKKRKEYDMLRKNPFAGREGFNYEGTGPGGFRVHFGEGGFGNLGDVFGDLFGFGRGGRNHRRREEFGDFMDIEDLFSRRTETQVRRGADVEARVTVPFELAANGGETIISTGSGKRIKLKIPPGIEEGKKIRVPGQGAPGPAGGEPGDLYVTINIAPHPEFERKGNDIYSTANINVAQAILGTEIQVRTVGNKKVKLKIPPLTSSGKVFRLPGMGIQSKSGRGDHYVKVNIVVPKDLTPAQIKEFKEWARKAGLLE